MSTGEPVAGFGELAVPDVPSTKPLEFDLKAEDFGNRPIGVQLQRMTKSLTRRRVWIARGIALVADAVQLVFLPFFAGGAPEGFDAALDAVVCAILCGLCGLHPAFLPAFVAEALPGVDLVPSWTFAVLYATRNVEQLPAGEPASAPEGTPKKPLA